MTEAVDVESDLNGRAAALIEQLSQDSGAEPGSDAGEPDSPPAGSSEGDEPEASGTDSAPAVDRVAEIEAQAAAERARRLARQERFELDLRRQSFDQEREQLQQQAARATELEASWGNLHSVVERLFELESDTEKLGELLTSYADGPRRAEMTAKRLAKTSEDRVAQLERQLEEQKAAAERSAARADGERQATATALANAKAVPRAAALAKRSPQRFLRFVHEAADTVRADPSKRVSGTFLHDVLYCVEEDLDEIYGPHSNGAAAPSTSPSTAANGKVTPKVIGNRAAAERGSLLSADEEDLSFDERVRRLEQRVRSR